MLAVKKNNVILSSVFAESRFKKFMAREKYNSIEFDYKEDNVLITLVLPTKAQKVFEMKDKVQDQYGPIHFSITTVYENKHLRGLPPILSICFDVPIESFLER